MSEWIKWSAEMPPENIAVLVYYKIYDMVLNDTFSGFSIGAQIDGKFRLSTVSYPVKITHWMPLPESPKK